MMHRLRRYDVFRFAQNDVAPLRSAMMRCLPSCAVRHTSLGVAVIIGQSPHHLPKANIIQKRTFVGRQKCVFVEYWLYYGYNRRGGAKSGAYYDTYHANHLDKICILRYNTRAIQWNWTFSELLKTNWLIFWNAMPYETKKCRIYG